MNFVDANHAVQEVVGLVFNPSKCELVSYFLKNKILGSLPSFFEDYISTVDDDVYSMSPDQFPFREGLRDVNEWYCFSTRSDHKLVTDDGYYSVSAEDNIFEGDAVVGFMRILTYYQGLPPKGKRTNWIVQEFRVNPAIIPASKLHHPSTLAKISSFVACKIVLTEGVSKIFSEGDGL